MKYTVDQWVFDKNPGVRFGIIIGKGIKNSETNEEDSLILDEAEKLLRNRIEPANLKTHKDIEIYRNALLHVGINPNKFMNSVEAMSKRVIKGDSLPRINALVDRCNAIALTEVISLGGHDLRDIDEDLEVRMTTDEDTFLPFGEKEFEQVKAGELVFTSGNKIQTRQWLWRQSELGKVRLDSTDVFFQLVGFEGEHGQKFDRAMRALENLVADRFEGSFETYEVNRINHSIEF
jgi:DNA/RNA-binding domain of Phe-tRNA-synthetase-like protein